MYLEDSTNREQKIVYLIFFLIGIFSFILGNNLSSLYSLHSIYMLVFSFLILLVLFTFGLILIKRYSLKFIFKSFILSTLGFILIFFTLFTWSAYTDYYSKAISVFKLQDTPTKYVNITWGELEEYPTLKRAINKCIESNEDHICLETPPDEWERTISFLTEKGSYTIKIDEGYYQVKFSTA